MSGYASIQDVKDISSTSRTDAEISALIQVASERVNHDMQIYVFKEPVASIDETRMNSVDGTNTEYYVQHYPIGDYDDDFTVDASDVTVWANDGETETELTVASVDSSLGKITMDSAPSSSYTLSITYCYLPQHIDLTSQLIRRATAYLTAFLCQAKVPAELAKSYTIDRLKVVKLADDVHIYLNMYYQIMEQIRSGTGNVEVF